jgi:uncharacterized membrane protein (DUF4010 family)
MESFPSAAHWPTLEVLYRLTLALGVGLFVGLEREWRGKEAGLRTFGFASLLGGMGGILGPNYALLCVALQGVLIILLNWQSLRANQGTELTTSAALLITGLTGVFCGLGQTIIPTAIAVVTAGLLAWKERLAVFSHKLTAEELRAAILLAILTFAVFPVLPTQPVDPWGLLAPRAAWMTVILLAAIGFVNYILWKMFGSEGIELTGFLGGLVNSTVAVTELANRATETKGALNEVSYRGVLLATAAMAIRNAIFLGVLAGPALAASVLPLALILIPCGVMILISKRTCTIPTEQGPALPLSSPFSLPSVLKFGLIFVVLQIVGTIAQDALGRFGFYAVSIIGGLVSSASAVASAASLVANGKIPAHIAGVGAVLASLASASVNIFIVFRLSDQKSLNRRLGRALILVVVLAVIGAICQSELHWNLWTD